MNKCKILRDLMQTLDTIVVEGTNNAKIQHVKSILGEYCSDGESFEPPAVDDFFTVDSMQHRVINAVMMDLNENDVVPFSTGIPVDMGTLLFALHEYQHKYHTDNDSLLVDGLSTLESRARRCIEDAINNTGWDAVRTSLKKAYYATLHNKGHTMAYAIFEVRRALQNWLPGFYLKIFIDDE